MIWQKTTPNTCAGNTTHAGVHRQDEARRLYVLLLYRCQGAERLGELTDQLATADHTLEEVQKHM